MDFNISLQGKILKVKAYNANYLAECPNQLYSHDSVLINGAVGGTRTHTGLRPLVFETNAYTIPPPRQAGLLYNINE